MRELTKQRDLAQSRVEDLLRTIKSDKTSSQKVCILSNMIELPIRDVPLSVAYFLQIFRTCRVYLLDR